ncbi:MAG: hypothetical protein OXU68_13320 [Bacteroidota bacterium]|nr:hypothetical protein [Bacteroidota bacterium]MDE2957966.1 hypothetical protein [Bacteroidota bacterium]
MSDHHKVIADLWALACDNKKVDTAEHLPPTEHFLAGWLAAECIAERIPEDTLRATRQRVHRLGTGGASELLPGLLPPLAPFSPKDEGVWLIEEDGRWRLRITLSIRAKNNRAYPAQLSPAEIVDLMADRNIRLNPLAPLIAEFVDMGADHNGIQRAPGPNHPAWHYAADETGTSGDIAINADSVGPPPGAKSTPTQRLAHKFHGVCWIAPGQLAQFLLHLGEEILLAIDPEVLYFTAKGHRQLGGLLVSPNIPQSGVPVPVFWAAPQSAHALNPLRVCPSADRGLRTSVSVNNPVNWESCKRLLR